MYSDTHMTMIFLCNLIYICICIDLYFFLFFGQSFTFLWPSIGCLQAVHFGLFLVDLLGFGTTTTGTKIA